MLYSGYTLYERFVLGRATHFVPLKEVDLVPNAVWGPGEGAAVRARDLDEKRGAVGGSGVPGRAWGWVKAL